MSKTHLNKYISILTILGSHERFLENGYMFQLKNKLTLLVIACIVAVAIFFRFSATNQHLQTARLHETSRQLLEASNQHYRNFIYTQISQLENDCKKPELVEKATPAYNKADSIYQILQQILRTADSAQM